MYCAAKWIILYKLMNFTYSTETICTLLKYATENICLDVNEILDELALSSKILYFVL